MLKILACIIIIIASTAIGFNYGEGFKKRTKQLNELQRCINQLQNDMIYTFTPLPEAIYNIAEKSKDPIKSIFKEISSLLFSNAVDSSYDAFYKVFKDKKEVLNLNKEDLNVILDLAKTLGECDIDGEKRMFSLTLSSLKKQLEGSEISMNNNVKMCRYLGFSLGAMVVIMLI
ncbi:stage III sporulation protein AB [Clostridium carboxidivorans P7]|uniref:Stage III sporulation protein AB n=1 Tax=Clostridium carboxidivorans P7 TaxID=536227 RepID=C6PQS6_9CLOT|nr:stage III sporulation protein SpoIIIAB [Clostridium carboxidivorans]AKN34020.1 stage III sporulation protein AB [Clostridium carboxidivorans P7]EET88448.1 stage III sporulation protein AB [Clostridium carboxidivorans P7]EFG88107.1 stage III sporulation protein AB [Clostridium carboxidivorans P7]